MDAGFRAEHGGSYRDPVTGINRQFDVRARYSDKERFLKLAIECKNLGENCPLVVSRIPRRSGENQCRALISVPGSGGPRISFYEIRDGLFPQGGPVGKSTAQVGRKKDKTFFDGDAEVYENGLKRLPLSHHLVGEAVYDYKASPRKWAVSLVLPILVVADKTLWATDYTKRGAPDGDPKQVGECSIYLNTTIQESVREFPELSLPLSHLLASHEDGLLKTFSNNLQIVAWFGTTSFRIRITLRTKYSGRLAVSSSDSQLALLTCHESCLVESSVANSRSFLR